MAAKSLELYSKAKAKDKEAHATELKNYLKKTEGYVQVHDYAWFIKGFYEIKQGIVECIVLR